MPIELSHSFNWATSGIIDCKFFKNPIWIALIITIIILIIIPLTGGSILWRGMFIFISSLILLFMHSVSVSREYTGAKEIEGAADLLGNLSYLENSDGTDINPSDNLESNDTPDRDLS